MGDGRPLESPAFRTCEGWCCERLASVAFDAVGVESLHLASAGVRSIYERAVAVTGVDPDDVLVVRVTERAIDVDAIDPDDLG